MAFPVSVSAVAEREALTLSSRKMNLNSYNFSMIFKKTQSWGLPNKK
jgi:hypothetical protein